MPIDIQINPLFKAIMADFPGLPIAVKKPDAIILRPLIKMCIRDRMYRVNIRTFSRLLHYFIGKFKERNRGAFITIGSLSGWTSLPFCAEYAAQKSYMMLVTEGVAYECKNTNVDVLLLTAGATITPTWLKNKPADPKAVAAAMYPEDVVKDGFDQLGKTYSYLAGEINRENMQKNRCV